MHVSQCSFQVQQQTKELLHAAVDALLGRDGDLAVGDIIHVGLQAVIQAASPAGLQCLLAAQLKSETGSAGTFSVEPRWR